MLKVNLQKLLFLRAVHPYCAYTLALYLTFFTLEIFPACPNIISWCLQVPKLPCRVRARVNVGYGEWEVNSQTPPRAGGIKGQGGDTDSRGGSRELEAGTFMEGMGRPSGSWGEKSWKEHQERKYLAWKNREICKRTTDEQGSIRKEKIPFVSKDTSQLSQALLLVLAQAFW